jgi:hypothetical protein
VGLFYLLAASGLVHHVGEGKARKVLAHVVSHVGPHAQQHALSLVIAGPILMGLATIGPSTAATISASVIDSAPRAST